MMNHMMALSELYEFAMPPAPHMFGMAGREHMEKYASTPEHLTKSTRSPPALGQQPMSSSRTCTPSKRSSTPKWCSRRPTRLQCSPTSDGSGAAALASEAFVETNYLTDQAIEIGGQSIVTDLASTFEAGTAALVGYDMPKEAGRQVFEQSGLAIGSVAGSLMPERKCSLATWSRAGIDR